jgi:hypothetical protein
MTETLDNLILEIVTLRGPTAVVVFLVMLGYILKMTGAFPNKYIPLVNFIVGPILTVFIVDWPTPGSMPHGIRYPDVASWLTALQTGFLLSCLAWLSHAQILRRLIDDKIPALNKDQKVDTNMSTDKTESVTTEIKP